MKPHRVPRPIVCRTLTFVLALLFAGQTLVVAADSQELEQARAEYERARPNDAEAARLAYVTRLAQIADRLVTEYRQSGHRNDDTMTAINRELVKHPAPANADSKKMSQLLIGRWDSPRRTYVFRADGKYGSEDGAIDTPWKVRGNKIIMGAANRYTIILLNSDYLIYESGGQPFFHSRVAE